MFWYQKGRASTKYFYRFFWGPGLRARVPQVRQVHSATSLKSPVLHDICPYKVDLGQLHFCHKTTWATIRSRVGRFGGVGFRVKVCPSKNRLFYNIWYWLRLLVLGQSFWYWSTKFGTGPAYLVLGRPIWYQKIFLSGPGPILPFVPRGFFKTAAKIGPGSDKPLYEPHRFFRDSQNRIFWARLRRAPKNLVLRIPKPRSDT